MRPQDAALPKSANGTSPNGRTPAGLDPFELYVLATPHAASAARAAVTTWLEATVTPAMLLDVLLCVSELVANSIRHADTPAGGAISVRAEVCGDALRVEVGDDGRSGTIRRRQPDLGAGGGFGLNVVDVLSRQWGVDRAVGTRVWAELAFTPAG